MNDDDVDTYEAKLESKTSRNNFIYVAFTTLFFVVLVGWRVVRLVNHFSSSRSTSASYRGVPVNHTKRELIALGNHAAYTRLGDSGHKFAEQATAINMIAQIYGAEHVPDESWVRLRASYEALEKSTASLNLSAEDRALVTSLGDTLRGLGR